MVLAVLAGVAVGILACLPLVWGVKRVRRVPATETTGLLGLFLASTLISLAILLVPLAVSAKFFRDVALGFALAELGVFVVAVLIFGFTRRKK